MEGWQDWVFTVGSIAFWFALVPMIRATHKPPKMASLQTSVVLYAYGLTFLTLGLFFSSITAIVTASLWLTLLVQKMLQDRRC